MSYRMLSGPFMLFAFFCVAIGAAEPTPKVLVIGLDGVRLDSFRVAKTPNFDALVDAGTLFAGTDILKPNAAVKADTISGPGWANLLTGVWPDKHKVVDNQFKDPNFKRYPHMFVRLKEVHPDAVTASFSTWPAIEDNIVSGADVSRTFAETDSYAERDRAAANATIEFIKTANPDLVYSYQGLPDIAGHGHQFHPDSPEYIAAIETSDKIAGELVAALKARPHYADEDWLVIVCTDHGGEGTGHGGGHSNPAVRNVFMIVSGAAAAKQGTSDEPTYLVDLVPTALSHLNVKLLPEWELDGRPIGLKKTAVIK